MSRIQRHISQLPPSLQPLAVKRHHARQTGDFNSADQLKQQLLTAGIEIQDTPTKTLYFTDRDKVTQTSPAILLFGSGETASVSTKAHTQLFTELGKAQINIAILTSPAGFQPNVDLVYQEIADFFTHSLQNFHPHVDIVSAHNQQLANDDSVISPLSQADYIFTGPGSPSYACKTLHNSKALKLIRSRVSHGVSLGLASAAAIAFSQWCLPVYEIYKVGEDLHWLPGLNFFADFYQPLTIVPHFNNQEGGHKLDTSFCYMGVTRFSALRALLPASTTLWGIDEHTAVKLDLSSGKSATFGAGQCRLIP